MEHQQKDTYDYTIKILLLGDSNVGKTLLIGKFIKDDFSENTLNTIGLDLKCKSLILEDKKTQADQIKSQQIIAEEKRRAIELEKKNRIKEKYVQIYFILF